MKDSACAAFSVAISSRFAEPVGQFLERQRLVEHNPRLAIGEPAHLAADRAKAFDHHYDLSAQAILLDRRDLDPAKRNVLHVDRVVGAADLDVATAIDVEPRRTRTKAEALLAPGQQFEKVDIMLELKTAGLSG